MNTKNNPLNIIEIKNDIFIESKKIKEKFLYVHCMNKSLSTSKGIVVEFEKKFNIKEKIKNNYLKGDIEIGACLITDNIANLITKNKVYEKPLYSSLTRCLIKLYNYCINNDINTLIMPKIGCGLDKLDWSEVKAILMDIFKNFKIIVCYL